MPNKPVNVEWNQQQLLIAKAISENKKATRKEIAEIVGCSTSAVYKVRSMLKQGKKPPSLDDEFIAKAPKPTMFVKQLDTEEVQQGEEEGQQQEETGQQKPKTSPANKSKGASGIGKSQAQNVPALSTTALQFVANIKPVPMTIDIFISYQTALSRDYPGELEDWISYCCRDFWLGRNVNMYEEMAGMRKNGGNGNNQEEQEQEVQDGTPTG